MDCFSITIKVMTLYFLAWSFRIYLVFQGRGIIWQENVYHIRYQNSFWNVTRDLLIFWMKKSRHTIRGILHLGIRGSWILYAIHTQILAVFIKTCSGCHFWIRKRRTLLNLVSYHFQTLVCWIKDVKMSLMYNIWIYSICICCLYEI